MTVLLLSSIYVSKSSIVLTNSWNIFLFLEKNDCAWYGYHCADDPIEPKGSVRAFEWKECAQLCQENPKCQFWHYWMKGKSCLFFDGCTVKREDTSISGSRYCPEKGTW